MESKKIITGDYEDTTTGIRFLQDIEGRIHCMSCMWKPGDSNNTVNNYNTTNNYTTQEDIYAGIPPVIIQTGLIDITWPNITDFHRINNSYSGGYVGYTTPINKEFHITSLIVTQGAGTQSFIGLYKAGNLLLSIPLYYDLNLTFFKPIIIPPATYTELKYRPGNKKLSLGICWIGYLI